MNTYYISYVKGQKGPRYIKAGSVNGFKPEADSYVFKIADEVVAVIPKDKVVAIQAQLRGEDVDDS